MPASSGCSDLWLAWGPCAKYNYTLAALYTWYPGDGTGQSAAFETRLDVGKIKIDTTQFVYGHTVVCE